jgi:hypothetical protein
MNGHRPIMERLGAEVQGGLEMPSARPPGGASFPLFRPQYAAEYRYDCRTEGYGVASCHRSGYGAPRISSLGFLLATFAFVTLSPTPVSAQNFFEALFGRRWAAPFAYADPNAQPETPRAEPGGSVVYCVRLCDGRFFPMQRHSGVSAGQACGAFCPASRTTVFHGSNIEHAVSADGKRYADLGSAFLYRERIVPDCTCNGKDAFGLVHTPFEEDATLRVGDIVATSTGLMAYNGGGRRQLSSFTPIETYAGVSAELRRRLTEIKVAPATPAPMAKPQIEAGGDQPPPPTRTGRGPTNKRVQVER